MRAYDLTHVPDAALCRDLPALIAQQRAPEAIILAHVAEYDSRALYLGDGPALHPSASATQEASDPGIAYSDGSQTGSGTCR